MVLGPEDSSFHEAFAKFNNSNSAMSCDLARLSSHTPTSKNKAKFAFSSGDGDDDDTMKLSISTKMVSHDDRTLTNSSGHTLLSLSSSHRESSSIVERKKQPDDDDEEESFSGDNLDNEMITEPMMKSSKSKFRESFAKFNNSITSCDLARLSSHSPTKSKAKLTFRGHSSEHTLSLLSSSSHHREFSSSVAGQKQKQQEGAADTFSAENPEEEMTEPRVKSPESKFRESFAKFNNSITTCDLARLSSHHSPTKSKAKLTFRGHSSEHTLSLSSSHRGLSSIGRQRQMQQQEEDKTFSVENPEEEMTEKSQEAKFRESFAKFSNSNGTNCDLARFSNHNHSSTKNQKLQQQHDDDDVDNVEDEMTEQYLRVMKWAPRDKNLVAAIDERPQEYLGGCRPLASLSDHKSRIVATKETNQHP